MMTRNIWNEIEENDLSEDQAEEIINEILDSPGSAEIENLLGFNRVEWTAYAHGVSLKEIASWRKLGWPNLCQTCGAQINIDNFGWRIVHIGDDSMLKHIQCPKTQVNAHKPA